MAFFSKTVEDELSKAIKDNEKIMFVVNGKLMTMGAEKRTMRGEQSDTLVVVIDINSELKASLYRYIGDTNVLGMKS